MTAAQRRKKRDELNFQLMQNLVDLTKNYSDFIKEFHDIIRESKPIIIKTIKKFKN